MWRLVHESNITTSPEIEVARYCQCIWFNYIQVQEVANIHYNVQLLLVLTQRAAILDYEDGVTKVGVPGDVPDDIIDRNLWIPTAKIKWDTP